MIERAEIERIINKTAASIVADFKGRKGIPGWRVLTALGYRMEEVGAARIPVMTDENLAKLVQMAKTDPYAYDGAGYLAGMLVAARQRLPTSLCLFAAQVLCGEVERPRKAGRPLSDTMLMNASMYALAIFLSRTANIPLVRSVDQKPDAPSTFSACDAVANAFTNCGFRTTYTRMLSICYDAAYADVRGIGDAMPAAAAGQVVRQTST